MFKAAHWHTSWQEDESQVHVSLKTVSILDARFFLHIHLLLFITRKYTFIYTKSYINNVNTFSITLEYISLVWIGLSIGIFAYVSIINNVNWQTNVRSDILSGNFVVIYIKIYFNNTNQQTIAFIDMHLYRIENSFAQLS